MRQGSAFHLGSLRMAASTSSPDRLGIMRSRSTSATSGYCSRACSASAPSYTSVTRNGPSSSFVWMMRPMCGSSSATSTCRFGVTGSGGRGAVRGPPSDESGDVRAVATQLVQQLAEVYRGLREHEQHGVGRDGGNHRESVLVLHDGGLQGAARGGCTELIGELDDRRNMRGDMLGIEAGDGLAVDQQAVASENDRRFDAFPLPDGRDEAANGWHGRSAKGCRSIPPHRVKSSA